MTERLQALGNFIIDRPALRSLKTADDSVFLTFDDGPDPNTTPQVLDLLRDSQAKACFFVVAQKAQKYPQLIQRIVQEGHSLGNHSLDHKYSPFFRHRRYLRQWIDSSKTLIEEIAKTPTVGFRPPSGILTPELIALEKASPLPLILWNHRFFDALLPWSPSRAQKSLNRLRPGDIVLLHDFQSPKLRPQFLNTLEFYLEEIHRSSHVARELRL